MKKISVVLMSIIIVLCSSLSVSAKDKTVNALQCLGVFVDNPQTESANKPSDVPTVKGTTIVKTNSKQNGFIRFKAPSDGVYKFSISDYKCSDKYLALRFQLLDNNRDGMKVSGLNNKNGTFRLETKEEYKRKKDAYSSEESFKSSIKRQNESDTYYMNKSVSVKLKKGEYVYIQTTLYGVDDNSNKASYKISIKKK